MHEISNRFGTTWWGQLWLTAFKQISDYGEDYLDSGSKYAANDSVSILLINPGEIQAKVYNRKIYHVTLVLPILTTIQWKRALTRIKEENTFIASLLALEMPKELDNTLREVGTSLYPKVPKELQAHCNCRTRRRSCKHIAAVCCILAEILDRDPWILFELRGKTKKEIIFEIQDELSNTLDNNLSKSTLINEELINTFLPKRDTILEPWLNVSKDNYDKLPNNIPHISLPKSIAQDPTIFLEFGPLPHTKIEVNLILTALIQRTAQNIQIQLKNRTTGNKYYSPLDIYIPVQQTIIKHKYNKHFKKHRFIKRVNHKLFRQRKH